MVQSENIVKIEGILSEIDLDYGSYEKDFNGVRKTVETIGGSIKVHVVQAINREEKTLEIPVYMFAQKYTNEGKPAFESIERVMKEFTSIAASDYDHADAIRITGGKITMNEYYKDDGRFVSFPRISASFVSKIKRTEMKFNASFSANFVVGQKDYETDKDGAETGRYLVRGIIPQYGNKVDIVPFYVYNEKAIDSISNYWDEYATVSAVGKLNFSSAVETIVQEVDFGEPEEKTRTINVSEFIITGGTEAPLDGDAAYDRGEIDAALADRKSRLENQKNKKSNSDGGNKPKARPNLGF